MGKGARLREQRRREMEIGQESTATTEEAMKVEDLNLNIKEEEINNPSLIERTRDPYFLNKNLAAMKLLGWDKNGLIDAIKNSKEIPCKIDPSITLKGVKNPLTTVYIGFSTRKLYDAMIRKKLISRYFVIIEPELGVFKHLIGTEDISDILLNPDIEFILGVKGEPVLTRVFTSHTKPVSNSAISRSTMIESMEIILDPFFYNTDELRKVGEEYIASVNGATHQLKLSMGCADDQFRRTELMIENKKNMYKSWKVDGLFDKFKDVPVIVLGGGPSLNGFIEEFNSNPNLKNALIIAADAVLPKLLKLGIKPHIITRCERKKTNIFHGLTKEMTKGVYYAAYPWTPPEYFDLFEDSIYLFRQNGVCLLTELPHGFIDGGVSASNAAFEMAIRFGAKNIILAGVDLVEIDGKTHTEGTQVEFNIEKSKEKSNIVIETNSGERIKTIGVWERCRNEYMQSIEKWSRKGKDLNVYNTSYKGAKIPLTTYKSWKDLSELFKPSMDVFEVIRSNLTKLSEEDIKKFEEKIKVILGKLKSYLEYTTVAIGLAEDAKRTAERELTKLVNHVNMTVDAPYDKIRAFRSNIGNYDKLWSGVSDAYNLNFKNKLYIDPLFRLMIFDVLQLDLYHAENAINSLWNKVEFTDERHYGYYQIMKEFAIKVEHYLKEFIRVFENGQ